MSEVAAVVLAAGTASRWRARDPMLPSKLIADFAGRPMVRWVVEAAIESRASAVVVVTGHAREAVEAALSGLAVSFAHNADFESGLASSLKAGIGALPVSGAGAAILLGDMPLLRASLIDRLIEAFAAAPETAAVVPVVAGRRGNPVVLSRGLFADVARLEGDEGARKLLQGRGDVLEIPVASPLDGIAVIEDIDTPAALARAAEVAGVGSERARS